jgi:hypothetical protein
MTVAAECMTVAASLGIMMVTGEMNVIMTGHCVLRVADGVSGWAVQTRMQRAT